MDQWLSIRLDQLPAADARFALLVLAALGLLYCFLGYRLFKLILGLTGFLLAGAVAAAGAGWLSQGHLAIMAGVALFGGLCGALALFFLYKAGVFCIGFLGALVITHHVLQGRPEPWVPWAILGAAAAGGLLSLALEKPVMMLATAAIGSWMLFFAGSFYMLGTSFSEQLAAPERESTVTLALWGGWAAVALCGVIFQFMSFREQTKDKNVERR